MKEEEDEEDDDEGEWQEDGTGGYVCVVWVSAVGVCVSSDF